MERGYLVFELKKDNGATPVCDAQVKILNIDGREVNRLLRVNQDGKTEEIEIYTKDPHLTFDQLNRDIPYTKVDAEIKFENDKIIEIDGIQVYSDVVSIQEVKIDGRDNSNFRSHKDKKGKSKKEHIHFKNENPCIFESDLEMKVNIKDDKNIKPIVKCFNVYIPEFITVHLGKPNENCETITIPFVDYIKNVTCSTIYPTWRSEAIKANVHSIVSFALNRIYTNWYRSKGYGFEITSDKNYDQMYVKGRTLFRNVCDIVDDVFDKCIKIEGFNQPFLAKCENSTNDYKVLSRWGSFRLAEDGVDALSILKKYFGDNIEIIEIPDVEFVIKKYPKRELKIGTYGEDVRFLQKALNMIGKKYKGISKITDITGNFGEQTERAVKDFQRIFNLKQDGIVGKKTWRKIFLVYSLIKKLFGYDGDIEEGTHEYNVLQLGSTGEDVKDLQEDLNDILGYISSYKKLKEDGIFGENTKSAVERFQKLFGLVVDGIVGKNTSQRIVYVKTHMDELKDFIEHQLEGDKINGDHDFDKKQPRGQVDSTDKEDSSQSEKNLKILEENLPLKYGSDGEAVKILQKELNKLYSYYGDSNILNVDSEFGTMTEEVVKEFQQKMGLPLTGVFDKKSFVKLVALINTLEQLGFISYQVCKGDKCEVHLYHPGEGNKPGYEIIYPSDGGKPTYEIVYPTDIGAIYPKINKGVKSEEEILDSQGEVRVGSDFKRVLKYGDAGDDVKRIQKLFNKLSEYYGFLDNIDEDGLFGHKTQDVIKKFQKKFALDVDGIFGKNTLNKIKSIMEIIDNLDLKPEKCKQFTVSEYNSDDKKSNSPSTKDIVDRFNYLNVSKTDERQMIEKYRLEESKLKKEDFKSELSMEYPNFDLEFGCISGYVTLAQKYINALRSNYRDYFITNVELEEDGVFGEKTMLYIRELQDKFRCGKYSKINKTMWNRLVLEYEKSL